MRTVGEYVSHGNVQRGWIVPPRSRLRAGRFGRMFRHLEPSNRDEAFLENLSLVMREPARPSDHIDQIPAGYTYFGQFIDHDLTFDPASSLTRRNDPNALVNFRTPRFDLDSLYGEGPIGQPYLYEKDRATLRIEKNTPIQGEEDLPRLSNDSVAVIPEPRNDENVIISQLHLAMMKFHNKVVVELLNEGKASRGDLFESAQQIVRWHYQWCVLSDFLPKLTGLPSISTMPPHVERRGLTVEALNALSRHPLQFEDIPFPNEARGSQWRKDLRLFRWIHDPFIPVEFSSAVFRFGHSMVRDGYNLNASAGEIDLFNGSRSLAGAKQRPKGMKIDWFLFFDFPDSPWEPRNMTRARPIDTLIAKPLTHVPVSIVRDGPTSLPLRNLLRGRTFDLPSGQAVAYAMGLPKDQILGEGRPLEIDHLGVGNSAIARGGMAIDLKALEAGLQKDAPLWYYTLAEAQAFTHGLRLGPMASRIMAEVFVGLLLADQSSFLNNRPRWAPTQGAFGCTQDGKFGIADFLRWAVT